MFLLDKDKIEILPEFFLTPNRFLIEAQKQQLNGQLGGIVGYMLRQKHQPEYITNKYPETLSSIKNATLKMRTLAFKDAKKEGFIAEYGVADGTSFIPLCNAAKENTVFGFDSFLGLENNGRWDGNISHQDKFKFNGKVPFVEPFNSVITKGWFDETLPDFEYGHRFAKYLHIDCDTYNATKTVLLNLEEKLQEGTVITFDDYFCNYAWQINSQFSAWQEFIDKTNIKYRYLYCAAPAVTILITDLKPYQL